MAEAGWAFTVATAEVAELPHEDSPLPLSELTMENAARKARAVAERHPGGLCIGADTLVALDGRALGKPRTFDEAIAMLEALSGRTHEVCTGVCLVPPRGSEDPAGGPNERRFHETTAVTFRTLTRDQILDYFSRVDPMDKAGAYGAQEHGDLIIARIDGSFTNVVGLPVERLRIELERAIDGVRGDPR